jgi:hypothetical protein
MHSRQGVQPRYWSRSRLAATAEIDAMPVVDAGSYANATSLIPCIYHGQIKVVSDPIKLQRACTGTCTVGLSLVF